LEVHERGSHGASGSVDPEGAARLGLLARGPGTVVDVTAPLPWPDGEAEVVDVEPGRVVEEAEPDGVATAKLDPVTSTTSALADVGSADPTSMVSEVEEVPEPPSPGS